MSVRPHGNFFPLLPPPRPAIQIDQCDQINSPVVAFFSFFLFSSFFFLFFFFCFFLVDFKLSFQFAHGSVFASDETV